MFGLLWKEPVNVTWALTLKNGYTTERERRKPTLNKIIIILTLLLLLTACQTTEQDIDQTPSINNSPVEFYAVLAEKDEYSDVDMTPLMVDYIDIKRLRDALEDLGWPSDQIHDLKEFAQQDLQAELDWLEDIVDDNDLVFFYVTGHGTYLRRHIKWNSFFPDEWAQINTSQRVLVVDSCTAAEFIKNTSDDPLPQISIAAVDEDEYGWKGIEEEGLPIIGGSLPIILLKL
jgi:hypothetical protein